MIGGFLGAGKTTTIAALAKHYVDAGLKVGLVTNDQAYDLVDTHTLRAKGFDVGEVPGACFCCKFDDLIETVDGMSGDEPPDLIIAEPVGSCTDLFATVIQPMRELFGDRFELGPLIVLLKPEHGKKILYGNGEKKSRGFSPKAEYIFLKQLEEADAIAINKADKLDHAGRKDLIAAVEKQFFGKATFVLSNLDGTGFETLIEIAGSDPPQRLEMMEVDYQVYAEGETELGWLNCSVKAKSDECFELDSIVFEIVKRTGAKLEEQRCETAHLKVLGQTINDTAVANLVGSEEKPELSLASEIKTQAADILVNARVAACPEQLEAIVREVTSNLSIETGVVLTVGKMQSFRPGKPVPTHRAV